MTNTSTKPISTIRDGKLSASLWLNKTEKSEFVSVTFARLYTNGEGKIQNANSFSGTELLRLSRLASKAYDEVKRLPTDTDEEGA